MIVEGAKFISLNKNGSESKVYKPKGRKLTVGYYINNDVILEDSRANSVHCEIQIDPFGRVVIYNFSCDYPISVNNVKVNSKIPLLNGCQVTILDENYLWIFHKRSISSFASISCPDLTKIIHPIMPKRFDVHNYSYSLSSNNIHSSVDLDDSVIFLLSKNIESDYCNTRNVQNIPLKDTFNLAKQTVLTFCQKSDIVVTSFTPQKSGDPLEKSFIKILRTPSKNACSTPTNSILAKLVDQNKEFSTPTSSNKHSNFFNSPMHVFDFTTPIKPVPSYKTEIEINKSVTELKFSYENYKSIDTSFSTLKSKLIFDSTDISSCTLNSTENSIISINSTDSQSIIDVSSDESSLNLSSKITMNTIPKSETSPASKTFLKETKLKDNKVKKQTKLFTDKIIYEKEQSCFKRSISIIRNNIWCSKFKKNGENQNVIGQNIRYLKKNGTTSKKINDKKSYFYYQDIADQMHSKNITNIYKENNKIKMSNFKSCNKSYLDKTIANLYSKICICNNQNDKIQHNGKILKVNYVDTNIYEKKLSFCNINNLNKYYKLKIDHTNGATYGCLEILYYLSTNNESTKTYFMKKNNSNEVRKMFDDFQDKKFITFKKSAVLKRDRYLYQKNYSRVEYTVFLINAKVAAKLNMFLFCNKLMNFLNETFDLRQRCFPSIEVGENCFSSKTENLGFFVKEGKIETSIFNLSSYYIYLINYIEDANRFYSKLIKATKNFFEYLNVYVHYGFSCVNCYLWTTNKDACFENFALNEMEDQIIKQFIAKLSYIDKTNKLNIIMKQYDEFLFQTNYFNDFLSDETEKLVFQNVKAMNKIKKKKANGKISSKIHKKDLKFSKSKLACGQRRLIIKEIFQTALRDNKCIIQILSELFKSNIKILDRNQTPDYTNIQLAKGYKANNFIFYLEKKIIKEIDMLKFPNFIKIIFNISENENIYFFIKKFRNDKNDIDKNNTLEYGEIPAITFIADRKKIPLNNTRNSYVKLTTDCVTIKDHKTCTKSECINPKKENCKYFTRLRNCRNDLQYSIILNNPFIPNIYYKQEYKNNKNSTASKFIKQNTKTEKNRKINQLSQIKENELNECDFKTASFNFDYEKQNNKKPKEKDYNLLCKQNLKNSKTKRQKRKSSGKMKFIEKKSLRSSRNRQAIQSTFNGDNNEMNNSDEKCVNRSKIKISESEIMPFLNNSVNESNSKLFEQNSKISQKCSFGYGLTENSVIRYENNDQEIISNFYRVNGNKLNTENINTTENSFQIDITVSPKNFTDTFPKYELRSRKAKGTKCNILENDNHEQFFDNESLQDRRKTKKPSVRSKNKTFSRPKKKQTILDISCNETSTNKSLTKEKTCLRESPVKCNSSDNTQTIPVTSKGYLLRSRKK